MSFAPGPSRFPAPRLLQGTRPGVIDSSQPARLLRVPGSTLSFAAFDPLTAASSGTHARRRHDPEPARPKRIVIETPPGGRGIGRWRFVPHARRAPGVEDEGVWPRRIIIDGEFVICSEDQWDIYKLDPAYDCFVPNFPGDPVITRKLPGGQPQSAPSSQSSSKAGAHRKRHSPASSDNEGAVPVSPGVHKKFRTVVNLVTDEEDSDMESITESDDEDEVEEIVAEEFMRSAPSNGHASGGRNARRKAQEARRKEQREKMKANMGFSSFDSYRSRTPDIVDLTMEDDTPPAAEPATNDVPPTAFSTAPPMAFSTAPPTAPSGAPKRKVYAEGDQVKDPDYSSAYASNSKKLRAGETFTLPLGPTHIPHDPHADRKRSQRKQSKMSQSQHRQEYANRLKEQRERQLWEDIIADTPRGTPHGSQGSDSVDSEPRGDARAHSDSGMSTEPTGNEGEPRDDARTDPEPSAQPEFGTNTNPIDEEEAARLAAIEESRRKLAELEQDRPLWEQEARRRAAHERADAEANRARQEEERRRKAAAAADDLRQRQRAAAAAMETERRARAEKERVEREREQRRRRERERWSYGPWTTMRAIERYKLLSDAFDAAKFTAEDPVMFEIIPWPVLQSPVTLRVEDIEWRSVEDFFAAARQHMRPQDYKVFVEKSHKRFHPDRWRARGVLKSVADEETRGCLEVAANTVAQALTPIWRDIRG